MATPHDKTENGYDPRFKVFHELMSRKVSEILLVSSLYDACIMEEDGRLSEKIVNEYRGLNLSRPPRLTWVSTAEEALDMLERRNFDMVITMFRLVDMDAFTLGREIKRKSPDLPVILLTHSNLPLEFDHAHSRSHGIDRVYMWKGNADILVALIKNEEDRLNAAHDCAVAGVRVILFVEDSPEYASALLPMLYKAVVTQVQRVMEEGLNEEHRLLTMRARPKILVAESYEEAASLYEFYRDNVLGVISDVRYPKGGEVDACAGVSLLSCVKKDQPDIPLLMTSTETSNRNKAVHIPACFVDKNSPSLFNDVHKFFITRLGFGDFVFRTPEGDEIARADSFRTLERCLRTIPESCFYHHWKQNDFSRWFFARSETILASRLRPAKDEDFEGDVNSMLEFTLSNVERRRRSRQKGILVNFDADDFDPETDFLKIGNGSLGGKARGLAFISTLLKHYPEIHGKHNGVNIILPQVLVITSDGFDAFVESNDLKWLAKADVEDSEVIEIFQNASFPKWLDESLRAYLGKVHYPMAVRSSALFEDAQFRAYAGLYHTCMVPNDHPDQEVRLNQLLSAVKLVYASTYFKGPKSFAKRVGHRTEDEKMAVIIQQVAGRRHGDYYYPAISGVAQSYNYYPFGDMNPEEGIATIAMGLGKTVVEGEKSLRFSPKRPQVLPQFSLVKDILAHAQQDYYALKMGDRSTLSMTRLESEIEMLRVSDADPAGPVRSLCGTYFREENRIKSGLHRGGHRVLTFDQMLKYDLFPLPEILDDVLDIGTKGMGAPVEIEFAVNLPSGSGDSPEFVFLQIRPMTDREELTEVEILPEEKGASFCYSTSALGNVKGRELQDIIYVKPEAFDLKSTREMALEIGEMNRLMVDEGRKYILMGPGRWGSSDRWLGVPVTWEDISGVGAIVETSYRDLRADPSQGSHFFHNITSLGINYVSLIESRGDYFDLEWLSKLSVVRESRFIAHVRLDEPAMIKVDGKSTTCVMFFSSRIKSPLN